jgi:predicted DNA binding CopG/RHH family protein
MNTKAIAKFASEAEEAQWWHEQSGRLTAKAKAAQARGELKLRRLAPSPAESPATPARNITIRVADQDLTRARDLAARRGMRYQTYIKALLHEALDNEEKRLAS